MLDSPYLWISLGAILGANLRYLVAQSVSSALHAVAGSNGRNQVHTSGLVEAGGNLPVIIIFVDLEEHVQRVLPRLKEMAPHRLIVRENAVIEQGSFD